MRGGSNFPMRDQRPVAHCFIRNATIPGLSQEARNPSAFPAKPRWVLPVYPFFLSLPPNRMLSIPPSIPNLVLPIFIRDLLIRDPSDPLIYPRSACLRPA
ncbi:hypothetical protein ALC56_12596 [Trachymyrmex septentrionalis]|uniref:Uncharacterized protein n=1 Tax=Trachymyrmex septentrionalis TaxID=34720 RepID=A0A195EZ13_9HYME|nr:hypothetical protein ALC56_12596 [Trachymyrmex septentrionalis]